MKDHMKIRFQFTLFPFLLMQMLFTTVADTNSSVPTVSPSTKNPTNSPSVWISTGSPTLDTIVGDTPTTVVATSTNTPIIRWSILLPLIAVSAVAWSFRKKGRQCLCFIPSNDMVPDEIVLNHDHWEEDSVVGDRDTDVELTPVQTLRSHDWSELGSNPLRGAPSRSESDYFYGSSAVMSENYGEPVADFAAMKDDDSSMDNNPTTNR